MKLTKPLVKNAILGSYGIITDIAKSCQVARKTIRDFIKKHDDLVSDLQQERESLLDKSEGVLVNRLNENDLSAAKYILSTIGKKRGYSEKTIVEQEGEQVIRIIWPDDDKL